MRQACGIAGFKGWNFLSVEPALSLSRFHHLPEPRFVQDFFEIAEIKRGAMLSIAEDKIGKAASQGIEMAREIVVEPIAPVLLKRQDGVRQAGDDDPHSASGLQYAHAVAQQPFQFIGIKMLDHVGGIDGINRTAGERQPAADVEPYIRLPHRVGIDVDEAGKVFGAASEVKIKLLFASRSPGAP